MTTPNLMESLPDIASQIDQAGSLFLGLDFDGTLAPICPRPSDVVLSPSVRANVSRLAGLSRVTVMIVSGRGLADVSDRLGLPELIYAGNHGMEIKGPGLAFVEPTAANLADRLRGITSILEERLRDVPGALVEPKGLTTSVHDRNVASEFQDDVERIVRDIVASESDQFVLTNGHRVWEVRPRVAWHKGQAIRWVLQRLASPTPRLDFYIGDDRTDEDAFAALPSGVTVRVGHAQSTQARYELADPDAVERFLGWLLKTLSQGADL
jgi:trehalose 6-phosphate phosphatase